MSNNTILVIGDIMLDHYIFGSCERISPEAPVPIVLWESEGSSLGGAANLASNLVSLGVNTKLVSVIGNDEVGIQVEKKVKVDRLEAHFLKSENRHTTLKTRIISGNHQISRFDKETSDKLSDNDTSQIIKIIKKLIGNVSLILISDYNKGLITEKLVIELIALGNKNNIPIFVDPKAKDFSLYKGVSLIKPNKTEAEIATKIKIEDEKSLLLACKKISSITEAEIVIVTLSKDGVALFENDNLVIIPTKARDIIDVTGAGDTFFAALSYSVLKNSSYFESCRFANYAAAVVIAKSGCQVVSNDEIIKLIYTNE